jgi:N-acetylmuramoyl-L-alanine amidase
LLFENYVNNPPLRIGYKATKLGGDVMAVVKASSSDLDLLARLLRAEAEGEGEQGMLLVGNVGINRLRANCSDFKGLRTIPQMVYQPHAFEATTKGYFYQRARTAEKRLAQRTINGERFGRQNSAFGISGHQEIARKLGIINLL